MTGPFRRGAHGGPSLVLDEVESGIVRGLLDQLVDLLESRAADDPEAGADPLASVVGVGGPSREPLDPALVRLFPTAYPEDDEAAGDFRRFTEPRLRDRKTAAVRTAIETLDRPAPVELDQDEALCWLSALNDLRLVLGVRLDVSEDDDPDELAAGPDAAAHSVYWWLGHTQESLLAVLA